MASPPPKVLTIAGSDSSGGAGIEADLKTFTALGVYGMVAITSVTAQNTVEVREIVDLPPESVAKQIDAVVQDIGVDAAKTGMLSSAAIVEEVVDSVERHAIPSLVVDPVMVSESGSALLEFGAVELLKKRLLPLAYIVTPNIAEAEALSGKSISSEQDALEAARIILAFGPKYVLVKGGHLQGPEATDWLFGAGNVAQNFSTPRLKTPSTHGTGCTYAAAIASFLAMGHGAPEAIDKAKRYLTQAIRFGFDLGKGARLLNHFWALGHENDGAP